MSLSAETILDFWYKEIPSSAWWKKDSDFDQLLHSRFASIHAQTVQGELYLWRSTAHGRLAEIIILDQFSRNLYRDTPKAFSQDAMALALSQEAVSQGSLKELNQHEQLFLVMPYMHSESRLIQEQSILLYEQIGLSDNLNFARQHKAIIDRFGRYPHRNAILQRPSTPEELEFLKQPNSSF